MSSYFDTMARKNQGLQTKDERIALANEVVERVKAYLEYIETHSPATYATSVHDLKQSFLILSKLREWDEDGTFLIENMHDMGHKIGTARIPVKHHPHTRFSDNPYWENHYEVEA